MNQNFDSNQQQQTWRAQRQQQYTTQYNQQYVDQATFSADVSRVMRSVYLKMFLALLVTAATSAFVAFFHTGFALLIATNSWVYWGLALGEIGLVLWISARLTRMSSAMATGLFYLFAVVNGLTLSVIFLAFTAASLVKTFLICSAVFGAMTVYGYLTNRDLTKIGSFLFMALIGLILVSLVNVFMHSDTLEWIISAVGVLIFIGLTAWDTQWVKRMAATNEIAPGSLATIGALSLYLDFINLFLYLLRFFGNRN